MQPLQVSGQVGAHSVTTSSVRSSKTAARSVRAARRAMTASRRRIRVARGRAYSRSIASSQSATGASRPLARGRSPGSIAIRDAASAQASPVTHRFVVNQRIGRPCASSDSAATCTKPDGSVPVSSGAGIADGVSGRGAKTWKCPCSSAGRRRDPCAW